MKSLIQLSKREVFKKGTYPIKAGTEGDSFYWVSSGKLLVHGTKSPSGTYPTLNTLESGDIFGEMVLLGYTKRTANIFVEDDAQVYTWNYQECLDFFLKNPPIAYRVMRNLASMMGERLIEMNSLSKKRAP